MSFNTSTPQLFSVMLAHIEQKKRLRRKKRSLSSLPLPPPPPILFFLVMVMVDKVPHPVASIFRRLQRSGLWVMVVVVVAAHSMLGTDRKRRVQIKALLEFHMTRGGLFDPSA